MEEFENSETFTNIKTKLLDYLSRQDYSEAKLLEKVCNLKKYYPTTKRYEHYTPHNVRIVIEHMKQLGYINEIRFLENILLQGLRSEYGMQRISQKMYRKKYHKDNIKQVLENKDQFETERDYSKIQRLLERKKETLLHRYPNESVYELRKRLMGFLMQKGFSYEEITMLLESKEE